MNSQFSYELDERQIRILMQSGELSFSETAWQRFDSTEKNTNHSTKVVKFIPNINLNFSVNRSIIIPIFFVALIGGMSILLFSFVDFKKKPEVLTEKPLIIHEPTVTKPVVNTAKSKIVPTVKAPEKTVSQPQITENVVLEPKTVKATETKPVDVKKETAAIVTKPSESKPIEIVANAKTEHKAIISSDSNEKKVIDKPKKKRKRRMVAEELPTINTSPASLSNQDSEPELDLK